VYDKSSAVMEHDVPESQGIPPIAYYQEIISRDLFRTRHTGKVASNGRDDTDNLETARLDARLWGTVSGNDSSRFAVIETKDSTNRPQQNLFREGDTIENAIIKRILRDKVVISLDGQRQLLLMEDYKSQGHRKPFPRTAASGKSVYRRILQRSVIEKAVSNVGQLMTQAKIMPRGDGLAISAIKPGSLFRRLGLRNGDVIEGVNGRTIQSVDDALSIYNRLRNDSSVTVDIKRGGRNRTLQFTIR
jgi:general secretion pathway protein C